MEYLLADGGDAFQWLNLVISACVGVGGAIYTVIASRRDSRAKEDREAVWAEIRLIRKQNEDCNRERGELKTALRMRDDDE